MASAPELVAVSHFQQLPEHAANVIFGLLTHESQFFASLTCQAWRYVLYHLMLEVHIHGNKKIQPACVKHMR